MTLTASLAPVFFIGPVVLGQSVSWTLVALLGALLVLALWRVISVNHALRELRRSADRLAQGDLTLRVTAAGPQRVQELADTLNQMARQLQDRLSTVVQQRNELGAVLSSMIEGVLAIDPEERIISLNGAAARLLNIDPSRAIGRAIQEVVRNTALQRFAARTLAQNESLQAEMTLRVTDGPTVSERYLQAQSAILRSEDGGRLGAVLVLHDVTQLRRLESVRRDFVANVSHEVKTPVSAIKAAVETLLAEDDHDPEAAEAFLRIVARQADRLDAIVEDLLSLARIEQESGQILAELAPTPVAPVLAAACETCQAKAEEQEINFSVECGPDLRGQINPMLLEQALVNLIDNAIKYSPSETAVRISAEEQGGELVLSVTDQGRGIEPEHLPRIFERFYRTDRARSRALGGTGLGLSIVKHIAEAHGGRVSVDSIAGSGSTFRIHLRGVNEAKRTLS